MVFKKLHLGTAAYGTETFDEIRTILEQVNLVLEVFKARISHFYYA